MTFSKTQRWLLLSVAALALPTVLASWWMVSSRDPVPVPRSAERIRHGEKAVSLASTDPRAGAQPHAADAGGTAQGNADADDFQQYAETLRAQGHPEKTVRELTASRITAAYQARRTALREQARRGGAGGADIQAQLDALGSEQGALIAKLFGAEEPPAAAEAVTAETFAGDLEKQILMPAAMAEAMPVTVKTEEQAADWEKVRTDFVNAIGGPSQDPANPQYRKRWVQAASEADQRFRLLFGDNAYVQHQMKAQQEAVMKEQGLAR
jgi:hypothetical protein